MSASVRSLHRRNLSYHWRMHLAVGLGVLAGTAALTGALLVGDSMRTSLRDLALARLAGTDFALRSPRPFDASLADRLDAAVESARIAPLLSLRGSARNASSGAFVEKITLLGVDDRFWHDSQPTDGLILNEALAKQLGARVGDDVLLRIQKPSAVSAETLLGRRDQTLASTRRTVERIVPMPGPGGFALEQQHQAPYNAFLPLDLLQRITDQPNRANTILVAGGEEHSLRSTLRATWKIGDMGLTIRADEKHHYVALESDSFLIEPDVERAARAAADETGARVGGVLTYLANEIRVNDDGGPRSVPYSTVAAIDETALIAAAMTNRSGEKVTSIGTGEILLNEWAADALSAAPGDRITLSYYITDPHGDLDTYATSFTVRDVVRLTGRVADPGFTPAYEGVTDTDSIADWDPPFPVDLKKVHDRDEDYWDRHRATPKAFITLAEGQSLWAKSGDRFGRLTALRVTPPDGSDVIATAAAFDTALRRRLDPATMGLSFEPVREQALKAGKGSTDFGGLFIGFSFFVIAAAAMLVALLFRLGVERRAHEVGLLLAIGYAPRKVARLLLADGAVVAGVGSALGLLAAVGYAWLMLAGLRSWWSDAANAPFLTLHVTPISLAIGFVAGVVVSLGSIAWSIRGLTRMSTRALLTGALQSASTIRKKSEARLSRIVAICGTCAVPIPMIAAAQSDAFSESIAYFLSGAFMLIAAIAAMNSLLRRGRSNVFDYAGRSGIMLLGLRNAPRNPGRSLLTIGLIASATFIIVSLQAFRLDVDPQNTEWTSGSGGFALMAESAVPLQFNLNAASGREQLNVDAETANMLSGATVFPFRLRPGEAAGCRNLYRPTNPRIVGAPQTMIRRGGFAFSSTLAESKIERDNPWLLLDREWPDNAIPVIGDEAAVKWQLHSGLGKDLLITDERGREIALRFVALMKGSALQDELIVSEERFTELFPSITGRAFFLIETRPGIDGKTPPPLKLAETMERSLSDFGFDAWTTNERLAEFFAVQNTYLSTFQTLGGLGLVLGAFGLTAVMLRNVWERRAELALMQAVGFSRRAIAEMVLSENGALVVAGLVAGTLPALLAVAPRIARDPASLPWTSVGLILTAVFAVGMISGAAALRPILKAPLLLALRAE